MKNKYSSFTGLVIAMCVLFTALAGTGLYMGGRYISEKLLLSAESDAADIALLVRNNFTITDGEAAYMKSITFNEMETDPINLRLTDIVSGAALNEPISNVYIIAPLSESEYRYCPDAETAESLGFETDTPLNGVWLLNGKINKDGEFEAAQREDIYRYTALDALQLEGMEKREPFGTFTVDSWGSFITGYAPIYTSEGNFVGLLGIDMNTDKYQSSAKTMVTVIISLFAAVILMTVVVFFIFHVKYTKAKEDRRRFEFYSRISHEMRTPMNGILGMAELAKDETDAEALRLSFAKVESSGNYLMKLINDTLDYQKGESLQPFICENENSPGEEAVKSEPSEGVILLCEDHPLNAEITRRMLQKAGFSAETAENGRQGLKMFEASENGYYAAVLMDIHMPLMNGIEAAKKIRALKRTDAQTVPIIALSANSYEEDIKSTREAGMNAHLTKPVKPEILYRTLTGIIGRESSDKDATGEECDE